MSDATLIIVVSSAQTVLLAILAAMVKIWSDRQTMQHGESITKIEKVADNQTNTQKTLGELEKNTNSMKDALVKVTGEKEFAKGLKQGTIEEQARTNTPKE